MNRCTDQCTYSRIFDEKMGDTIHLALGRSIEKLVCDDNNPAESAIHDGIIVDMSTDFRIELVREVVQCNGSFVFQDDFTVTSESAPQ